MLLRRGIFIGLSMLIDCSHSQLVTKSVAMMLKRMQILGYNSSFACDRAFAGVLSLEALIFHSLIGLPAHSTQPPFPVAPSSHPEPTRNL